MNRTPDAAFGVASSGPPPGTADIPWTAAGPNASRNPSTRAGGDPPERRGADIVTASERSGFRAIEDGDVFSEQQY